MRAPDLIFELRSKGYSIRADGGYLDISPADNLPPELVQNIRQSKVEILAALQSEFSLPEGKPSNPAQLDDAQAICDIRATLQANGFSIPKEIIAGEVCWAGDTWILLFADMAGFAVGKSGDDLVFSGRLDGISSLKTIESRAERAAYFVRGQVDGDHHLMKGILSKSRSLGCEMSGIGEGFREWQFYSLPETIKREILILLARIAEASYRRGIQQGNWAASTNQKYKIHPDKLRFGTESLDSARMPLCGTGMASLKRLSIQHGSALAALGFDTVHDDIQ